MDDKLCVGARSVEDVDLRGSEGEEESVGMTIEADTVQAFLIPKNYCLRFR